MQTATPNVKRRCDYREPDFFIDKINLIFYLQDTDTRVIAESTVRKNGKHDRPLVLDGEQMTLSSVSVNDAQWSQHDVSDTTLTVKDVPDIFTLKIETQINPLKNTSLEGLYMSGGAFCTQCEAEGFRKITYFLDRPDVLAEYHVTITGDKERFPYLLSNGNKVGQGDNPDGTHWVSWHDPFKKPCYLFALVAGDFDLLEDTYTTGSGKEVAIQLFVDKGKLSRGEHAIVSLKKAMQWDEEEFGLEYDLDIYMIVAVDFFNMGAMENKGLNIFNSKFVLADSESATDEDFFNIESVIAHEYFHNWTGNRVTCRDWFQLSLKEGLTVFRDQQFSSDMSSALSNRIRNVKVIREHQFAEDASAMSHPIRPDEVIEMNNFYTVTVYDKGSEVIRMLHTLLGKTGFRKGMDLYFERHDGQAVTCDDFVNAMQDANDVDLEMFKRWYGQSGTPIITAEQDYDAGSKTLTLRISQETPPTADQPEKLPLHIPLKTELVGQSGNLLFGGTGTHEDVLDLTQQTDTFIFEQIPEKPVPILLGDFSAPVKLNSGYSTSDLMLIALHANDAFSRWDASQQLFSRYIHQSSSHPDYAGQEEIHISVIDELVNAIVTSNDVKADLITEMLTVPSFETLCQQVKQYDVDALYAARVRLIKSLAETHNQAWQKVYEGIPQSDYAYDVNQVNRRKLKNLALIYLATGASAHAWSSQQFNNADNMTDTLGALKAAQYANLEEFDTLMAEFELRWRDDPLVLDKWFGLHASTDRKDILARLQLLSAHKQYSMGNPNRVRALVGSFAFYNPKGFHSVDGRGYEFLTNYLLQLDEVNPQVSARIVTPLTQWQALDKSRQEMMRHQLMRLANKPGLSKDLTEKVTKSLAYTPAD